jgi:predicted dehydrogenase
MSPVSLRLALVGVGYWGPNLLRAVADLDDVDVTVICDTSADALALQARRHPSARVTQRLEDVLEDDSIDAVIVATPVQTHHEIARRCMQAHKHVLVEKPIATTSEDCRDLISCALERGLILMPGHVFLYSPPVVAIKRLIDDGALGDIYFITSTRVNLGIHRSDSSVIQDLAPHDFSILHYWFGLPTFARAIARDSVVPGLWDVAFIDLGYAGGMLARVELSWLAPTKLRRTVVAGSRAMVVYDDTSGEQVRIFDRGAELLEPHNFGEHRMAYRLGDVLSPHLDADEPLRLELEDFVASIRTGEQPRSHMRLGLDIVRMVEAAERSLVHNGAPVQVIAPDGERRHVPDRRSIAGVPRINASSRWGNGGVAANGRRARGEAARSNAAGVDA